MSLQSALDTIPALFSTLRMVWLCSSSYGCDLGPSDSCNKRFKSLIKKAIFLIHSCLDTHLRRVLPLIGKDFTTGTTNQGPNAGISQNSNKDSTKARIKRHIQQESSSLHRQQKQVALDCMDICTTLKESYYKTKMQLEAMRATYHWDTVFEDDEEEDLFTQTDYRYERSVEVLTALDTVSLHYTSHSSLRASGLCNNSALLSAALADLCDTLNTVTFDFLSPENSTQWATTFDNFRRQSEALTTTAKSSQVHSKQANVSTSGSAKVQQLISSILSEKEAGGEQQQIDKKHCPGLVVIEDGTEPPPLREPAQSLALILSFNPPDIQIIGPIKLHTVENLAISIPKSFATTTSKVAFGKIAPPKFVQEKVVNSSLTRLSHSPQEGISDAKCDTYWHYRAVSQFCSDDVGQSHLCSILLDALEAEGGWVLNDTNSAYLPQPGGVPQKVVYKFFFRKHSKHRKSTSS
eukprot:TRINITY_DN19120_c0_g1_i1.p1 TRINITY_DN19120_c0_g1~~TRINITY_DN19120_c0_g1_i1.p1  ORF type:complete len:538 (+),score=89.54 TRINITY_DN19120_c0_g1_i1:223-1614(+)